MCRYSLSRVFWLRAVTFAAVAISGLGILYAVEWGEASDGGRGGAIGCAITFLTFFVGRPTAKRALETRLGRPQSPTEALTRERPADLSSAIEQLEAMKMEVARTRAAVAIVLDVAAKEKPYLAVASVVSTLAWGFGDCVARGFGAAVSG